MGNWWNPQDLRLWYKNSPYHALDCKLGGYVSVRHNSVRDTIAFLLKEAKYRYEDMSKWSQACPLSMHPSTRDPPSPRLMPDEMCLLLGSTRHLSAPFSTFELLTLIALQMSLKTSSRFIISTRKIRRMLMRKGFFKPRSDHSYPWYIRRYGPHVCCVHQAPGGKADVGQVRESKCGDEPC